MRHQRLDDMKFDEGDAHDYVVAGIVDSAIFDDNDGNAGGFYYLIHWKEIPRLREHVEVLREDISSTRAAEKVS